MKGNQVAPAELEGVLLEHPEVQDAAVIGIKQYFQPQNDVSIGYKLTWLQWRR